MEPKISLFASAARPKYWRRLYDSLKENKVSWELVFVGPNEPLEDISGLTNFIFAKSLCKPCQCYQAASNICSGELIGWMADDAVYSPGSLDFVWDEYLKSVESFKDKKTVLSQMTLEDYTKYNTHVSWDHHRFYYGNKSTPQMAPIGFMNRGYFNQLGGYDIHFVCGQAENDIVMRVLQDGGRVVGVEECPVKLCHSECHGDYPFSKGYAGDRRFLEECWVSSGRMLTKRTRPVESFEEEGILIVNQGRTIDASKQNRT